jgi:hypothetical protein
MELVVLFKAMQVAGRIQFPVGCRTDREPCCWLSAVGSSLLLKAASVLRHGVVSLPGSYFLKASRRDFVFRKDLLL